jgi:hypothetical protein
MFPQDKKTPAFSAGVFLSFILLLALFCIASDILLYRISYHI